MQDVVLSLAVHKNMLGACHKATGHFFYKFKKKSSQTDLDWHHTGCSNAAAVSLSVGYGFSTCSSIEFETIPRLAASSHNAWRVFEVSFVPLAQTTMKCRSPDEVIYVSCHAEPVRAESSVSKLQTQRVLNRFVSDVLSGI